jgi:hypothetical protein
VLCRPFLDLHCDSSTVSGVLELTAPASNDADELVVYWASSNSSALIMQHLTTVPANTTVGLTTNWHKWNTMVVIKSALRVTSFLSILFLQVLEVGGAPGTWTSVPVGAKYFVVIGKRGFCEGTLSSAFTVAINDEYYPAVSSTNIVKAQKCSLDFENL